MSQVLEKLVGRKIVGCQEEGTGFVMELDNSDKVTIRADLEGGQGADSGWYQWGVLYVNGERVGSRA